MTSYVAADRLFGKGVLTTTLCIFLASYICTALASYANIILFAVAATVSVASLMLLTCLAAVWLLANILNLAYQLIQYSFQHIMPLLRSQPATGQPQAVEFKTTPATAVLPPAPGASAAGEANRSPQEPPVMTTCRYDHLPSSPLPRTDITSLW